MVSNFTFQLKVYKGQSRDPAPNGFTLLEVMVVVVIVGVLAAIATPSWLQFLTNRQVEAARDQIHQGIHQAQAQAIANRMTWQFSIREPNDRVEWAIHQHNLAPSDVTNWQPLDAKIVLDKANTLTLEQDGVHYITFDFKGTTDARSIVTIEGRNNAADKKCVLITNLLGNTKNGEELSAPNRFGFECF